MNQVCLELNLPEMPDTSGVGGSRLSVAIQLVSCCQTGSFIMGKYIRGFKS